MALCQSTRDSSMQTASADTLKTTRILWVFFCQETAADLERIYGTNTGISIPSTPLWYILVYSNIKAAIWLTTMATEYCLSQTVEPFPANPADNEWTF